MPVTCFSLPLIKSFIAVLWGLLVGVVPVVVRTNGGVELAGNLNGFTDSTVRIDADGSINEIAFEDLSLLRPQESESRTGPTFRVTLVGGSRIAAQELSTADNELTIEPRRQNSLRVPLKQVKAIRFRAAAATTDAQWLGIREREQRGDTLVIRRAGDRLDAQQGLVVSVNSQKVQFDLDGTIVDAPVDRLEGVTFGGNRSIQEDASIQVTDVYGSTWAVLSIEPSQGDQPLRIQLSDSIQHELPVHQVASIRWSGGVLMLAEEKAASESYQSAVQTSLDPKLQNAFFGPSVEHDADLRMHGGSFAEYRVEPGYQTLAGAVARHEKVSKSSSVTVHIELDGKSVWKQTLVDSELRGFELPLQDARRLAIRVESDGDGELGDTVRIVRPRLLK